MVVKKYLLTLLFVLFSTGLTFADSKQTWLSGSLTLAPGYLTSQKLSTISLHGFAEYFVNKNISIRVDGFAYFGTLSEIKDISHHHQGFMGLFYHFQLGSLIPYIGIQPGFGLFSYKDTKGESPLSLSPLFSTTLGIAYMGARFFHIFAEAKYVYGVSASAGFSARSLSEVKGSFGLGFHL